MHRRNIRDLNPGQAKYGYVLVASKRLHHGDDVEISEVRLRVFHRVKVAPVVKRNETSRSAEYKRHIPVHETLIYDDGYVGEYAVIVGQLFRELRSRIEFCLYFVDHGSTVYDYCVGYGRGYSELGQHSRSQ